MFGTLRDAVWAAAFIRDFIAGERPTFFKRIGGTPRVTSHVTDAPGRRPVPYDLYVTPSRTTRPRPALIVTHGFTGEGAHDHRLQALCRRLARLGWIVMAPEFPQMRRYRIGLDDTDDLETSLSTLTRLSQVDPAHIGVVAFSFGAAPMLIGLSREPVRSRVTFGLVFGGYFDLKATLRYVLTGAYDGEGHRGRVTLATHNDDRWKFLVGNIHLIPESPTREHFLALVRTLEGHIPAVADITAFSAPEQILFRLVDNRDPDRFDALYGAAAPYIDAWVRAVSPCYAADGITTRLVIVHSETDQKIHFTESLAMARGVLNAPRPTLAILNTFAHVDLQLNLRSLRSIVSDVLPGLRQLWGVGLSLVREQST